jgi:hypothetical protein
MTLLSARDTPIARRFEIWVPDANGGALVFGTGDCDQDAQLPEHYKGVGIPVGEGTIGQVWQSGTPAVRASLADDPSPAARSAVAAGLDALVAVPIVDHRGSKAVVAWYL